MLLLRACTSLLVIPVFIWLALSGAGSLRAAPSRDWTSRQAAEEFIRTVDTALAPVYGYLADYLAARYGLADSGGIGIDLGGGPGHLVVELSRRSPRMRWVNLDINPNFFPFFRKLADSAGCGDRVEAVAADAVHLPFPDGFANLIVSRGSYQFWSDREAGFREIQRVLKLGGRAFIGRGFPPNLPVEAALKIRSAQDGGPAYDPDSAERELAGIMKRLGVENFSVIRPRPKGADSLNYGVWIEFSKTESEAGAIFEGKRAYTTDTLIFQTSPPRDPVAEPRTEPVGLASTVSVVGAAEITRQGATTLVEALEYVPGAWVESRGRKVKQFFSTRGQRYPYPDYALDGAWQREFHEMPYFFPAEDIERLEVMRSSAALLNGLSGLSGVVNIRLRRLDYGQTSTVAEYGSFGSYRLNLGYGNRIGNLGYTFSFGVPHSQGPEGRHAGEGLTHFRGSLYWTPGPHWSVTAHLLYLDGYQELAQARPPAISRLQTTLEKYDPYRASLVTVKTLYTPSDRATTEFVLNLADRDHKFVTETTAPAVTNSEHDYEWSANLTQAVALSADNVLRFGGLYNHWAAPNGKRFYVGRRTDLETWSAVAVDQHSFGRLTLDAGLRWARTFINEYGAFNIDGTATGFAKVAPVRDQWEPSIFTSNLGAAYSLNDRLSLNFNLSRGSIKPRAGELDVNLGTPRTEGRTKLDLGLSARLPGLTNLAMTGFLVRQSAAIVLSGQTETVGGRELELYLNRDQNQVGLEIEGQSTPIAGRFQLFGNLTAMRSRAETLGTMKKNRELPQFITGAGVYCRAGGLDATLLWKYVSGYESARFAVGNKPQPLGKFHTLGLTAGYTFGRRPEFRVYFEANNIGDDHYSTVVGYPDYGRRFTVGVRTTIE
ncbi:MAG: TonB-dependent receptor plug domain-containing protein [Candidatus Glassbacteria bacterium]